MNPAPFIGIVFGALAGGFFFVVFGLMRAVHRGGFSIVFILNKFSGKPVKPTTFIRLMVVAGIILSIVLGIAAAVILGGAVGGVIEYLVMKIT
ncbi:MAG: hypothetical protein WA610_06380 [Thermodesulfovibrionales bacterium]